MQIIYKTNLQRLLHAHDHTARDMFMARVIVTGSCMAPFLFGWTEIGTKRELQRNREIPLAEQVISADLRVSDSLAYIIPHFSRFGANNGLGKLVAIHFIFPSQCKFFYLILTNLYDSRKNINISNFFMTSKYIKGCSPDLPVYNSTLMSSQLIPRSYI